MGMLAYVKKNEEQNGQTNYVDNSIAIHSPSFLKTVSQVKQEVIERIGYEEASHIVANKNMDESRDELMPAIEAVLNISKAANFSDTSRQELATCVFDDIAGLGPIQSLLENNRITEIMVNGYSSCFYEQDGIIHSLGRIFDSDEQIMVIIDRIVSPLGRRVDERSPMVNARLKNGFRVNAVIPPIALNGPILTIRKFSSRINSLEEFVRLKSLPAWYAQMLSWAVYCRENIAVAGGTGSGKTTLLNALSCEISPSERIITIEDSAELKFSSHPHVVRLEARAASIEGEGEITIRDLVINALRMRPDRIIVGEVRGAECIDMLQAMNTGHDGSLTTLHAGSAEEAIARIALLARFGIDLPADLIDEQIATAFDGIVMTLRTSQGKRYVSTYSEISRKKNGRIRLTPCVGFDDVTHTWSLFKEPHFITRAVQQGLIKSKEVEQWRQTVAH